MKISLVIASLAIGALLLWRFAKQESGFLWESREEAARDFTQHIGPAVVERFKSDMGRYPTSEEGISALLHAPEKEGEKWKGPYLDGPMIPKDPWGHNYCYRAPSRRKGLAYEVFSLGPDGKISDDDIGTFSK
jgi:general secretion pathway protein G